MNAEILRTKGSQLIQNLERSARRTSKSLIQLAVLAGVVGYAFLGGGVNSASADGVCSGVESFSSSTNEARFVMDADCAAVNVAGIANKYGFPAFDLTNRMFKSTNINSWDLIWKDTDGSPFEIIMRNEVDGTLVVNVPGGNPVTFTPQQFADLLTEYSVSADGLPSSVPVGETPTDQAATTVPTNPTAMPVPTAIYPAPAGVWVGENFLPDEEDQVNQKQTETLPFAVTILSMPWCWGPLVGIASFLSYQIISARNRKKQYEEEQTAAERRAVEKEEKRKQKKRSQATVDDQYYFDEYPTSAYTPPTPRVDTHVEWPAFESSHQLPEPDPGNAVATQGWAGQLVNLANSIIYASQMRDGVEVVDAEVEDVK